MDSEAMTAEDNQSSIPKIQLPDGYKRTEIGIIPSCDLEQIRIRLRFVNMLCAAR